MNNDDTEFDDDNITINFEVQGNYANNLFWFEITSKIKDEHKYSKNYIQNILNEIDQITPIFKEKRSLEETARIIDDLLEKDNDAVRPLAIALQKAADKTWVNAFLEESGEQK